MNPQASPTARTDDLDLMITRMLDAPRELVFQAWTDPEQLVQWYAPPGCQIHFRQINIQEGGTFHSCIQTPDGFRCWCVGKYAEIVAPERIVFTMASANEDGQQIDSAAAGHDPDWPAETTVTVTLSEVAGQTKLTLTQTVRESLAKRTGAHPSWIQMLDRLAELVERVDA